MQGPLRPCQDHLLLGVTISAMVGSALAFWLAGLRPAPSPALLPGLALPLATATLLLLWRRRWRLLAVLPFFCLVGLFHTHRSLQPISDPDHIATLITKPRKVTLIGRIMAMPEDQGERLRFEIDCLSILFHDPEAETQTLPNLHPIRGKVRLSLQTADAIATPSFLMPGNLVMVLATVDRIRSSQIPGVSNYPLQMAAQSLWCSGWIRSPQDIVPVVEPDQHSWQRLRHLPERIRQQTTQMLLAQCERPVAGIYQALLIGSTTNIPPTLLESFKNNGCIHILAISGAHLSLLGLMCYALLSKLGKTSTWLLLHTHVPTLALLLTAPILVLYTFIAGFNIPVVRALLTAFLVLFAVVVRRQRRPTNLIAAAALLLLAANPLALATPSLQLSFAAVLAINLIYPRLPLFQADTPSWSMPPILVRGIRALVSMLLVALAATAGTLPILLFHFNRFSLIAPVMNILLEPLLCLWALPCGLLAIAALPLSPDLAHLLIALGQPSVKLAIWLSESSAGIPLASLWTITPNLVEITLYYLILFLLLQAQKSVRSLTLAAGLALVLITSFTASCWAPRSNILAISTLDVGQGAATLVRLPSGAAVLVDGGGTQSDVFDPGERLIAPFLWQERLWRLDDVIVSHPHQDHFNGLPFILAHFKPQRLLVNGDPGDDPAYGLLLETARRQGVRIEPLHTGDTLRTERDLRWHCLGMHGLADGPPELATNDRSLVLRLDYGARSFLFPGDISSVSENRLLRLGTPLKADVLLAPHHGSRTSAGKDFLAAVQPALILVSAGIRQWGTLPAPEHLEHWRQENILPLVTSQEGTITCTTDGEFLLANSFIGGRLDVSLSDGKNKGKCPNLRRRQ